MKAIVFEQYGAPEVLQIKEIEKPTPKDNEVLIKVFATTVTSADCRVRAANFPFGFGLIARLVFGLSKPRKAILGTEISGEVEAVGKDVTALKVGDPVFAFSDNSMGCYVEYLCVAANDKLSLKPANLSFAQAAALSFGGTTALDFFRRANLERGESVLIVGASGCVGTAAIQLAKHIGAEVTGVCSTENVALVKSLGADHVIDYKAQDFTRNGKSYDVIMDTIGTAPYSRCKGSLTQRGRLLMVMATLPQMLMIPWYLLTSKNKFVAGPATVRNGDLLHLAQLAKDGHYKPVIDRSYAFEEIIDAHCYVDSGRKKGNVIVRVCSEVV